MQFQRTQYGSLWHPDIKSSQQDYLITAMLSSSGLHALFSRLKTRKYTVLYQLKARKTETTDKTWCREELWSISEHYTFAQRIVNFKELDFYN